MRIYDVSIEQVLPIRHLCSIFVDNTDLHGKFLRHGDGGLERLATGLDELLAAEEGRTARRGRDILKPGYPYIIYTVYYCVFWYLFRHSQGRGGADSHVVTRSL